MKYLVLTISMFLAAPVFAAHEKVEVGVNGMVCDFCAQGIKKQFKKEAAVEKIEVDLDNKKVTIHLKHDTKLADDTIKTKLKDAGYEVTTIQRS